MPKPWAKYEADFVNHRKFLALPANAICLWLEGKNYADSNLTDGLLPFDVVKHFRFFSRKSIEMLTTSAGPKAASNGAMFAPLWEKTAIGWRMHDYLEHNDCREVVLKRMKKKEDKAAQTRQRQQEYRDRQKAQQRGTEVH